MMVLIIGGSGSGKSAYAEKYVAALAGNSRKYYIATMQVFDEEGQEKVKRHQKMRAHKGFYTIEQPLSVTEVLDKIGDNLASESIALLECISNLAANEMFSSDVPKEYQWVSQKIIQEVEQLNKSFKHLVAVTNNVFEDGINYDATTRQYIRTMGDINQKLAMMADKVIEIVVGIPIVVKEGK
ncbi:bifunctional adenosylcobinamide kinase/adenosylcobinamide-phosphate guanylyltransferase [Defluviitalea saccharophila]|uniref:Adenosylcobinamide kinase n=1 Tax=Defluviitalea saccharophila TaxID=879970 RepID=A0ABZ2Y4W7_9FIRM